MHQKGFNFLHNFSLHTQFTRKDMAGKQAGWQRKKKKKKWKSTLRLCTFSWCIVLYIKQMCSGKIISPYIRQCRHRVHTTTQNNIHYITYQIFSEIQSLFGWGFFLFSSFTRIHVILFMLFFFWFELCCCGCCCTPCTYIFQTKQCFAKGH